MYCHKCGAQVDDQAAFCEKCGTALQKARPEMATSPTEHAPATGAVAAFPSAVQYAGFWKRLAAFLIDGLLLAVAWFVMFVTIGVVYDLTTGQRSDDWSDSAAHVMQYLAWAATAILGWLYYAAMESSAKQATLGKMALGTVVTDVNDQRVSFGRATGRYFGKIVSQIVLFIGYFMIAFTPKKQGLHDIMADCLVVAQGRDHPQM